MPVSDGLTPPIAVALEDGASSMLLEIRSQSGGFFFVDRFVTPSDRELAQSGLYVTREAREVSGLADFLYPNDDTLAPIPGVYQVSFRATSDREGTMPLQQGEASLHVYTVNRDVEDTCGIYLDFLVDYEAIDRASFLEAVGQLTAQVDRVFREAGIGVIDSQVQQISLRSPNIDVADASVLQVTDDVLRQARDMGSARAGSLRVLVVRSIAGEGASGFNPAGYSMGLPGPYDADRPNATVLVATDHYRRMNEAGEFELDVSRMGTSLAHELGHFLGLYHTSELDGQAHDPLDETPQCLAPLACDAAFRSNIMTSAGWLTAAGFDESSRTGFTSGQGRVMRRHPLCIPFEFDAPSPPTCTKNCSAPRVCALLSDGAGGRDETCSVACDPRADLPCESGECIGDALGTNVCR